MAYDTEYVMVEDVNGYHPEPVAMFSSRAKAEAFIQLYEDAVTRATSEGVAGICRPGALAIAEHLPLDPEHPREFFNDSLYIHEFWGDSA